MFDGCIPLAWAHLVLRGFLKFLKFLDSGLDLGVRGFLKFSEVF